jgi:hypothetical protein
MSLPRRGRCRFLVATGISILFLAGSPASAQWAKVTLPGTPRHPNGTPDLTAPAPRTPEAKPDLSGVWQRALGGGASVPNLTAGASVTLTPAAEAIYQARLENHGLEMPSGRCLPHGLTKALSVPEPFKIVQTPSLTLLLHEEFNNYRQIFTAGSAPPRSTRTWFGHSVGRWEGDTFVVHTDGFIDDMWIDVMGHPATAALQVTERIRRIDFGHLESQITIEDPGAYAKPWTLTMRFNLLADAELIEDICESERDSLHMVGK